MAAALLCPLGTIAEEAPATPATAAAEAPKAEKTWLILSECEVSAPIDVPAPVFADIKNLKDKTYDTEAALRTPVLNPGSLKFSPVVAGEDKFLAPEGAAVPAEGTAAQLRVYRFYVTSRAFTKAKLMVTTPQYCEVYVDGVKLADKLNAQEASHKSPSKESN